MKYFPKKLTISWIRNSYLSGKLTPLELMKEIVKRARDKRNKNIWIIEPDMCFIKGYIEKLKNMDIKDYPLWGIPFAIKDNIDLENMHTTAACNKYSYLPKESAYVVKKLIKAGAVPVGKTNLDQFATGLVGTRSPYGEVHNSLNDDLISGGSSSGSAVAVALGMSAFSLGTDTAGSGRVPAALNCIVGLKPSLGAWSTRGVVPACATLDCVTVFANNLEDALLVDKEARGFDKECAFSKEYKLPDVKLPEKICLPKNGVSFYGPYKDIYEKKWQKAVKRVENMGIKVEYIDYSIFEEAASILYDGPWIAERFKDLGEFVLNNEKDIFPVTKTILMSGNKEEYTAASLFKSIHKLRAYKNKASQILKNAVLVMPTCGGTFTRDQVREDPINTNSLMGKYTNHCNLLDMCALAVPENTNDFNIPFGITVFGMSNAEDIVRGFSKKFLDTEAMEIAVCGLHMENMPLESEITSLNGYFNRKAETSQNYKMVKINGDLVKPGLIRDYKNGHKIELEIFNIPLKNIGKFVENIKYPLGIGNIELDDGTFVKGFVCEKIFEEKCENISEYKSFRNYLNK